MCDNTDCKNIDPIVHYKVVLRDEFYTFDENETCIWCLDCVERDKDMIKSMKSCKNKINYTSIPETSKTFETHGTVQYDVYDGMIHFLTTNKGFECFLGDFLKDYKNKKVEITITIKEVE